MSIYDLKVRKPDGTETSLGEYRDRVVLIVNTASECGFTPQFAELQKLYETYRDKGFAVLGFPCNQFGGQEPGTAQEAQSFCSLNYGVDFPMFGKVDVNGADADPLFAALKERTGAEIKWNFTKFLIGKNEGTVKHYEPNVQPMDVAEDIEKFLSKSQ
jgi:glutathione peroxidase-family protein